MVTARACSPRLPPVPPLSGRRDPSCWLDWVDESFAAVPERAWHSRGVWHRVAGYRRRELVHLERARLDVVELAALLHDIGKAIDPQDREPHGFAGARFLDEVGLTDVAPLVAHHSGTKLEASWRGFTALDSWPAVDIELLSVLDYADGTVSSTGESVNLRARREELSARYGEGSLQVRRFDALLPDVLRTERALARNFGRTLRGITTVVGRVAS